jgi:hypothetical protein
MTPMSEPTNSRKKWTIMFYFASDNSLAPIVVSQLKAIKDAGYHHDTNVLVYFDPEPGGTPSHIFDVNVIKKLENPGKDSIGFHGNDPFVRDLMLDKLWGKETDRDGQLIRKKVEEVILSGKPFDRPEPPDFNVKVSDCVELPEVKTDAADDSKPVVPDAEPEPAQALATFLDFCAREPQYQADHYMLFILGHGVVVGDDIFLFDEHAATHSITLTQLGCLLTEFKRKIPPGSEFELVGFHSCSVSSVEVAFELQGTATRMLASQGPAFVGSWPYRQLLISVFNHLRRGKLESEPDIEKLIKNLFFLVLHNSADYMLAGYSFDLALCDLRQISALTEPIHELAVALKDGLPSPGKFENGREDEMVKSAILLAHLKSQSYWQENYTDLCDFCFCLIQYCETFGAATGKPERYEGILNACRKITEALVKQKVGSPIIQAKFAGPDSQYSHGFSVFFPWTRPVADKRIVQDYAKYKFSLATQWLDFLDAYWGPTVEDQKDNDRFSKLLDNSTMRPSHNDEKDQMAVENAARPARTRPARAEPSEKEQLEEKLNTLMEDIASLMFNQEGTLNTSRMPSTGGRLDSGPKDTPQSSTGDSCTCGSIKNHLRDTRKRKERTPAVKKWVEFSESFFAQQKKPTTKP